MMLVAAARLRHHGGGRFFCRGEEGPRMRALAARVTWLALSLGCATLPAYATAPCGGDFGTWLQGVKTEAAADGISQRTIQSALAGITYDPSIVARDHAQGVFRQSFEQFSGRMVPPRLARGQKLLQQY